MTDLEERTKTDYRPYVEAWRARLDRQDARRLAPADSCARHLVEALGARRVYLLGSLLDDDLVHAASGVGLAVAGLPAERYFEGLAALCKPLPAGVTLDPVDLDRAGPGVVERVERG